MATYSGKTSGSKDTSTEDHDIVCEYPEGRVLNKIFVKVRDYKTLKGEIILNYLLNYLF